MNRHTAIAILGVAFVVGGMITAYAGPGATPPAAAKPPKIGYVDLQRSLNETAAGKRAKGKLEGDKKKKQGELDKKQKELQGFAAELDKQRAVLKPDVLRQREKELQEKYVQLQERYFQLQQELAKQEATLVRDIFGKAAPIIQEIAKRDGYTMILEKNEGAVLWADGGLDITSEVNKKLQ
jgi:outer membrane protein